MAMVLLFSRRAAVANAARLHSKDCPLVRAALASKGRVAVIEKDLPLEIADLNERNFPVKRCKCLKG